MNQPRIILASASKQRLIFMQALDLELEVIPANIDEQSIRDADLKTRAEKIARAKAEKVASTEDGIIIAADTFLEVSGEVFEKPKDLAEAKKMLSRISENTITGFTGLCYLDKKNDINFSACIVNQAEVRKIPPHEIEAYVEKFPVTTWSGGVSPAYAYGATFFKNIQGSPSAFTHGLPMDLVIPLLESSGVKVVPK